MGATMLAPAPLLAPSFSTSNPPTFYRLKKVHPERHFDALFLKIFRMPHRYIVNSETIKREMTWHSFAMTKNAAWFVVIPHQPQIFSSRRFFF
jgi:hypothetical protein